MSAPKLSFTLDQASEATGISRSIIERAINANNLVARYPSSRPVIQAGELERWMKTLPTEKPRRRVA